MKRDKFIAIFIFSIILFFLSFSLGYRLMSQRIEIDKLGKNKDLDKPSKDLNIVKQNNIITPNTLIEERIYYKECGHLDASLELAKDSMVNMTELEFKEYLAKHKPNFRLISFSGSKVVIWSERNHLCKNHYVIGEENGYIAIFRIDENGERVLDNVFNEYPISLLIEIDQERIRTGIIVDSEEELYDILENFIS